jgi:site-specific recombinase XerC
LRDAGVGSATIATCHRIVRATLAAAVEDGRIGTNPAAGLGSKLPKVDRHRARILGPNDVARLTVEMPE